VGFDSLHPLHLDVKKVGDTISSLNKTVIVAVILTGLALSCPSCPVKAQTQTNVKTDTNPNWGWPGPVPQDPDSYNITAPTPTPTPTPTPGPTNNTTISPQPKTLHVRIAVGGDPSAFTPETLAWYQAMGVSEIHIVPSNYYTYPELATLIKSYGMYPIVDVEYTQWVGRGYSIYNDGTPSAFYYAGLRDAGWVAIASEGLSAEHVNTIRQYLPFISYGGDDGVDLYRSQYYHHSYNSHAANYQEVYYSENYYNYLNTLSFAAERTPHNFGMTIGLWGWSSVRPATLSMNPDMIGALIRDLYYQGHDLNGMTFLFWTGAGNNPILFLQRDPWGYGGDFVPTFNFVRSLNGIPYTAPRTE
jgi:hypothetical protein